MIVIHKKFRNLKSKASENLAGKDSVLLSQWQICVEMANSISERRDKMNNLFVTLNLAIVTAISFRETKSIILLLAGIFVCIVWVFFIKNFKELNKAKFDVIIRIEKRLPVQPFCDEWKKLKKRNKYVEGTTLELYFPIICGISYILALLYMTCRYFCNH